MIDISSQIRDPSFYVELKSWQSAIGSVLGFVALATGALINYNLNRKRDRVLRCEEATAVATALYGEMVEMSNDIAKLLRAVSATYIYNKYIHFKQTIFETYDLQFYELPKTPVYMSLIPKLGLLPTPLVVKIVQFYGQYGQTGRWLSELVHKSDRPFTVGVSIVLCPGLSAIREVEAILRSIEMMASINGVWVAPDVGQASDALALVEHPMYQPRDDVFAKMD